MSDVLPWQTKRNTPCDVALILVVINRGEFMALTKKQRKLVFAKSGGRCWYCGSVLLEKGWHERFVMTRMYIGDRI